MAPLLAQQQAPEVQDLLTSATSASRGLAPQLRVVRPLLRRQQEWLRHAIAGEGYLLARTRRDDFSLQQTPLFSEDTLIRTLVELRGVDDGNIDLMRLGERVSLESNTPELVQAAVAELRSALPRQARCRVKLERIMDGETTVLLSGTENFVNGETLVLGEVERASLVTDVDVEIAQASSMGNPVVTDVTYGASAALRVRPVRGSDDALVEVVVRTTSPFRGQPLPPTLSIGRFDRLAHEIDEAGFVFRVGGVDDKVQEWTADDGSLLRLSCGVDLAGAANETSNVIMSPLMQAPVVGFRSSRYGELEDLQEVLPVAKLVAARVQAAGDGGMGSLRPIGDIGAEGSLLYAKGDAARDAAQRIFRRVDEMLQSVAIELEVLSVPVGSDVAWQRDLPAGAKILHRMSVYGVMGLPVCCSSGHERTFLRDWNCEVAQAARIADPVTGLCEDGWFVTAKPMADSSGALTKLDLALEIVDFVGLEALELPIASRKHASTADNEVVLEREVVAVERARTRSLEIYSGLTLDDQGCAVVRRSARRLLGDGRELVVRLCASKQ
ncbi:MAG: hypothetical protein AB8H80_14670 [Planctomycetota bacterium]